MLPAGFEASPEDKLSGPRFLVAKRGVWLDGCCPYARCPDPTRPLAAPAMDPLVAQALRTARAPVRRGHGGAQVLVAGGAGALGSAVLEALLALPAFVQVKVLVSQVLNAALPGLEPVPWPDGQPLMVHGVATAVVVFDRARHANGREAAFWRPQPADLPSLAAALRLAGVRHLLVVVPHAAASLPHALRHGLANLDEQGVAGLGFDHLVFMRPAQAAGAGERPVHPGQRLARWMLSQLQLMVPAQDKPVRALKVAQFAAQIAAGLATSPPGTRVVPSQVVWEAAQTRDLPRLADDWLNGRPVDPSAQPAMRL